MLCTVCQNIFRGKQAIGTGDTGSPKPHHATVTSLRDSAQQECQICVPLWSQFTQDGQVNLLQLQPRSKGDLNGTWYILNSSEESEFESIRAATGSYELLFLLDEYPLNRSREDISYFRIFAVQPHKGKSENETTSLTTM